MGAPGANAVIEQLYEAVLDADQWAPALSGAMQLLGAQGANLFLWDERFAEPVIAQAIGNPAEAMSAYAAHYHRADPMLPLVPNLPAGSWINDWRDCPDYGHGEWYNDFLRPFGLYANLAMTALRAGGLTATLSFQRASGQPPFGLADERMGSYLHPHIRRALQINQKLQDMGLQAATRQAALDAVCVPLFTTDSHGLVVAHNAAADEFCSPSSGLSVRAGRLVVNDSSAELHAALARACDPSKPRPSGLLLRPSGGPNKSHVLVVPLSPRSPWAHLGHRLALVAVQSHEVHRSDVDLILREVYGLTMAESRVARMLGDGISPQCISELLDCSPHTVRSQLKAIFLKTGVRRQGELVKLVAEFGRLRL